MKTIALEKTDLSDCVSQAQSERVVVTHKGAPVALVFGLAGLDREQLALGTSDEFRKLIRIRRSEKTVSRAALEATVARKPRKRRASSR